MMYRLSLQRQRQRIGLLVAVPVIAAGLFGLGAALAPVVPIPGINTIPAFQRDAPMTVVSRPADGAEVPSPANAPLSIVQTDDTRVSAGGLAGGVVGSITEQSNSRVSAGALSGGVVGSITEQSNSRVSAGGLNGGVVGSITETNNTRVSAGGLRGGVVIAR